MTLPADDIADLLRRELVSLDEFVNYHGITRANVEHFLVPPRESLVDPDDGEGGGPVPMWVVMQEAPRSGKGAAVVYDPSDKSWGIAEPRPGSDVLLLVSTASSLKEALEAM